ncbi:hypothetical protein MYP_1845 [Sporocytophaga myxococcoides]|uniref:Uncharacterized protein n=1 Tax=Sporocytophaga myxococcoides TaxID=153721 RepID=A0A098LDT0_9BACT|nr:DUF4200 domain-containing protein [Sporocytophaga myxococcoides]GAL84617.1 hypothetical protein MYP_1845 [Sporocytophaga myxococcoides]
MKRIKFLAAALCLCSGSLFAQSPSYTPGSNIAAGKTTGAYRIYGNTGSSDGPGIEFYGKDDASRSGSLAFSIYPTQTSSHYGYYFTKYTGTTWKSQFAINKYGFAGFGEFAGWDITAPLQVDKNFGRVGIGTLGVSSFGDAPGAYSTAASLAGGIGYIGFNALRQTDNAIGINSDGTNNGGAIIAGTIKGGLNFITFKSGGYGSATATQWASTSQLAASIRMSINPNGKVFIGDPASVSNYETLNDFGLYVKGGGVRAERFKCDLSTSGWADYVFEPTYKLKPLEEVEQFIKENKHLPEVPSAKKVEADGIDVAEMDAILLKKIEELTLYMIELKKENAEMKKELELLQK